MSWKIELQHTKCPYRFDSKPAICDKVNTHDIKCRKKNCPLLTQTKQ